MRVHHYGLREGVSISGIELKLEALTSSGDNGLHQPPVRPFWLTIPMGTSARRLSQHSPFFVAWRLPREQSDTRVDGELLVIRRAIFLGFSEDTYTVFYYTLGPSQDSLVGEDVNGVDNNGWLFDDQGNLVGMRGPSPLPQSQREEFLRQELDDDDPFATPPRGIFEHGVSIFLLLEILERWSDNGPRARS